MYWANTSEIQLLSWNTGQIQMFCTRWSYKMLVHLIASKTIQLVQLIQIHEQNTNTNIGTNYTPDYPLIPFAICLCICGNILIQLTRNQYKTIVNTAIQQVAQIHFPGDTNLTFSGKATTYGIGLRKFLKQTLYCFSPLFACMFDKFEIYPHKSSNKQNKNTNTHLSCILSLLHLISLVYVCLRVCFLFFVFEPKFQFACISP